MSQQHPFAFSASKTLSQNVTARRRHGTFQALKILSFWPIPGYQGFLWFADRVSTRSASEARFWKFANMVSSSQILPEWCKSGPRGAAALPADSPIVSREQQKDNVEIVGQNQRPAFGWSSRFGDRTEVLLPVAYLGFSMLRATMSYLIFWLDTCYRKRGFSTSIRYVDLNSAIFRSLNGARFMAVVCICCHCCQWSLSLVTWNTHCLVGRLQYLVSWLAGWLAGLWGYIGFLATGRLRLGRRLSSYVGRWLSKGSSTLPAPSL